MILLCVIWGLFILVTPFLIVVLFNQVKDLKARLTKLEQLQPAAAEKAAARAPEEASPAKTEAALSEPDFTPAETEAESTIRPLSEEPAVTDCAEHSETDVETAPAPEEKPEPALSVCAAQVQPEQPVYPEDQTKPVPPAAPRPSAPSFSVEQLLSWTGGFILFLGLAFFVKYSIDNELLGPQARILLSCALGAGLLIAGLLLRKENVRTTAHTLCGCGLAVLYIAVFAAHSFYDLIPADTAFAYMAGIALLSFGVAVWKNAKYIGFLAEITGFLTPFLLAGAEANILFFLSYVAFITAASCAAALKRGWNGLLITAAVFTFLCQASLWLPNGLKPEDINVFCLFSAGYAAAAAGAAYLFHQRTAPGTQRAFSFFIACNILFVCNGVGMTETNPAASFTFLNWGLWLNFLLILLAYHRPERYGAARLTGKVLVFIMLLTWTQLLPEGPSAQAVLGYFLAFAAINGGADFLLYKKRSVTPRIADVLFPVLLMLPLLFKAADAGFLSFFPLVTLMSVLLLLCAAYALLIGVPLLTLAAAVILLTALGLSAPGKTAAAADWLWTMGFTLLPAAGVFALARRINTNQSGLQTEITVFISALMPYFLAAVWAPGSGVSVRLLMGFVLAVSLLNGLFAYIYKNGKPMQAALAGAALVQLIVQQSVLTPETAMPFMKWSSGIFAFFALYPFVFKKRFFDDTAVWRVCALSGLATMGLLYLTLHAFFQVSAPGLLPLAFAVLYLTGINLVYFWQPLQEGIQRSRLVWLGGVTTAFITLIFPIQFSRQWLTLAWALEGVALIRLHRKLNHNGLTATGFVLLCVSFIRLLIFVPLGENFIEPVSFFNTYLYSFGIGGAAMLLAAHWWPKTQSNFCAGVLEALGAMTWFLLLNIQIALHFYEGGPLEFNFTGAFSAAIMYTAGWTFAGAVLLLAGWTKKNASWYAGLALIGIALLKLFFADIWLLDGLFRIGGMIGIAVMLIAVSFVFQIWRRNR